MPRFHETFRPPIQLQGVRVGDLIIILVIFLSALSIFDQTTTAMDGAEKEKDKRIGICLKDFKDS